MYQTKEKLIKGVWTRNGEGLLVLSPKGGVGSVRPRRRG